MTIPAGGLPVFLLFSTGPEADVRVVKQTSLCPEAPVDPNYMVLAIPGSAPALSRAQKQFNKLVGEIAALRKRLSAWQDYPAQYQRRIGAEHEPLRQRLREARIAMTVVFDRALGGKGLTRREQEKMRDLLTSLVSGLLEDESDPALEAFAARHGLDLPTHNEADELDMLELLGSDMFGVDLAVNHGADLRARGSWLRTLIRNRLDWRIPCEVVALRKTSVLVSGA